MQLFQTRKVDNLLILNGPPRHLQFKIALTASHIMYTAITAALTFNF